MIRMVIRVMIRVMVQVMVRVMVRVMIQMMIRVMLLQNMHLREEVGSLPAAKTPVLKLACPNQIQSHLHRKITEQG
jgi:hypothetical protein